METAFFVTLLSATASFASAGIIITPILANQTVEERRDDCRFGVLTPDGCGSF